MVRYWCNVCAEEHDNALDCPNYGGHRRTEKVAKDFRRRAKARDNNYQPIKGSGESKPKSGCVVVGVALIGAALACVKTVVEVFS